MRRIEVPVGDDSRGTGRGAVVARRLALLGALTLLPFAIFASSAAAVIPPVIQNSPPVAVSGGIELKGTIYTYESDTHYHFEYGTTTAYGTSVPVPDADAGTQAVVKVAQTIVGLQPSVTYHYRLVASNAGGEGKGPDATFGTSMTSPPANEGPYGEGGGSTPTKVGTVKLKIERVKGRRVLASANGHTLYSLSAERHGRFVCTKSSGCLTLWHPVLIAKGAKPRGPVKLGTVRRPEGELQVTFRGHPLYSFAADAKPGQARGEGLKDVGTWHAVKLPRHKR